MTTNTQLLPEHAHDHRLLANARVEGFRHCLGSVDARDARFLVREIDHHKAERERAEGELERAQPLVDAVMRWLEAGEGFMNNSSPEMYYDQRQATKAVLTAATEYRKQTGAKRQ